MVHARWWFPGFGQGWRELGPGVSYFIIALRGRLARLQYPCWAMRWALILHEPQSTDKSAVLGETVQSAGSATEIDAPYVVQDDPVLPPFKRRV